MTPEEIAEKKKKDEATAASSKKAVDEAEAKKKADAAATNPPNPVKEAIDKARQEQRPEIDKAAFSLKKNAERLKELGGNPAKVLGIEGIDDAPDADDDDDKPITRGELKRMRQADVRKTAIQLSDSIQDADERELTRIYLQTRIVPSGDPQKDFEDARALVNSVKTRQVLEEKTRKDTNSARRHSSGSGAPSDIDDGSFSATDEEITAARIAKVKPEDRAEWIKNARKAVADGNPSVVRFGTAARKKREAESAGR